jgi:Na+-driven multidrug efflux pump
MQQAIWQPPQAWAVLFCIHRVGQLGRDTALGYAMGARLEYILQPIAFGFGTAIVAMVGTNWGAQQYSRAREIAWTGATTVALVCGTIGLIVAFQPGLWIGLFSDDAEVARLGTLYLRIVGPAYLLLGLGFGLFYVTLSVSRAVAAMNANAVRMVVSASGGLVAIYWFDLGVAGFLCRRRRRILRLRGAPHPRSVQRENTKRRTRNDFLTDSSIPTTL